MLYFNKIISDKIKNQLNDFNKNDLIGIKNFLNEHNLNFVSLKKFDNGEFEYINNNDYILLGPCGGVYETAGKYSKFSGDNDNGVIDTLTNDIRNILSDSYNFDVLNIG